MALIDSSSLIWTFIVEAYVMADYDNCLTKNTYG